MSPTSGVDGYVHMGKLLYPTAPGICGRVSITTSHDNGTNVLTIATASPQPYLRVGANGFSVDLFDANMTLLASNIAIDCVDDSHFTRINSALPTATWMTIHGVDWTKNDSSPKRTGVKIDWSFNIRAMQEGYVSPPSWYAGVAGCTGATVSEFTYPTGGCKAVVGVTPGPEVFNPQTLLDMGFLDTMVLDYRYGSLAISNFFLTMPDPFWQPDFKPDCHDPADDTFMEFGWNQDDGSSQGDSEDGTEKFFPHRPLVEAKATLPAGATLPSGISLAFDPDNNVFPPPFFQTSLGVISGGLPIGDVLGNYASLETDWSFTEIVCSAIGGRFGSYYTFVDCSAIP